jgi:glucose dehydrogenase
MKLELSCALIACALLSVSACNRAKSPEDVQADVAKAQAQAADANAKADEKVKQIESTVVKDRADALAKVADKNVDAVVDSAVTQAEGDAKVARAKCQSLQGDAQKSCISEANARLDEVKARAKAAKSSGG